MALRAGAFPEKRITARAPSPRVLARTGASRTQSGNDVRTTSPRLRGELRVTLDTLSHYSPMFIAPLAINSLRRRVQFFSTCAMAVGPLAAPQSETSPEAFQNISPVLRPVVPVLRPVVGDWCAVEAAEPADVMATLRGRRRRPHTNAYTSALCRAQWAISHRCRNHHNSSCARVGCLGSDPAWNPPSQRRISKCGDDRSLHGDGLLDHTLH